MANVFFSTGTPFSFQYVASWNNYDGPRIASVKDGGSLVVRGGGFADLSTGLRYVLKFSGRVEDGTGLPELVTLEGVQSEDQISFSLPDWPFVEQYADVSLHRSVGQEIVSVVPFVGNPSNLVIQFQSVWDSARLMYTFDIREPIATAPSIGGSTITILGRGKLERAQELE
jgi:hypothetical protein